VQNFLQTRRYRAQLFRRALSILAIACLPACSQRRDPQATLDRAIQTFERGDIADATKQADEGYRRFHSGGGEWAWKFTILRARILHWRGKDDKVLEMLASEPQAGPSGAAVEGLRLEALAYGTLRRFPEAERSISASEELCANSQETPCIAVVNTRGVLEMRLGRYRQAQDFFARAAELARQKGAYFQEADSLLDLSWSANQQTHFDEALDWANAARQIADSRRFTGIAQTALGNMGWAFYKLGDPDKAEDMFAEAGQEAHKIDDPASEAGWLAAAGYAYMDRGDLQLADQSFRRSVDLMSKASSPEDLADSITALAFLSEQTNKLDDAQRYADEALKMAKANGNGHDVVYPLLVKGRVAARRNHAATAEANFTEVAKSPDTPVFLKWEAERSLARLYEDEKQAGRADAEYRIALSTFEDARCGLHERVDSRLPFLSNAARIYEDYIHFLVAHGNSDEALRVADYTRARTLTEGLGRACKAKFAPDPLNAPEIARRAGGTVLFYALGQGHSYLWAITPQQVRIFPLAANQAEIDAAVESYRKKLEGSPATLEASNDASDLYQMLVAPAQDFLKTQLTGENANIFIVPDAGLNSLNFETLMPRAHHYWIEDVTIANAPSLQLLSGTHASGAKLAGKLLLLGNPVAPDAGADNPYPELPNAAQQMVSIQKYFPVERQQVFTRAQALPAAYLGNHPERFSYIHFVAHGTASRSNPLDSAIILSRDSAPGNAARQDDSFKLYARQIIGTQPLRAELVTISACYSTGKRTYSGEGLVGLSWAFLYKGAHNVVAALWDVSDESAPQLVDEFYGELKKGKPTAAALRAAKLSQLHSRAFHNPFYWAPFQLYTRS
jgi:CHAT domain-containing protein